MPNPATYTTSERMRGGRLYQVRALQPDDREDLVGAVREVSADSLYRRFFGVKRDFSEQEIDFFSRVDFVTHVALVAVAPEAGRPTIIAGGRYIVSEPGQAELAFIVVDAYQGQGIGTALMRHLVAIARTAGLTRLMAEALPDNASMLKVFQKSGLPCRASRDAQSVRLVFDLA